MTHARAILKRARGLVLPILLLLGWQYYAHLDDAHSYIFVPLEAVAQAFIDFLRNGELVENWQASLLRTSTGFAIGSAAGIALGALMALSPLAERLVNPLYNALRQVPLLGWIPLISLWFGNGAPSKVFIVGLAAFYPTVLNTFDGLTRIDPRHAAVGRVYKVSRLQYLRHIALPSAMPGIYTGLMQATAFAWLTSIGGEFFFNPGPGLGNLMLNGQAAFRMEVVFLAVIVITLTGYLMNASLLYVSARSLRWRSVRRGS
jgi:sulfonate transport system permease protein